MYHSVNKIKNLAPETRIFCGHEYTKSNLNFCMSIDKNNKDLKIKEQIILAQRKHNIPTIPTTVMDEQKTNIFLDLMIQKLEKLFHLKTQPN